MARAVLFLVLLLAILSCFTIRAAEITDPDLKAKVEDAEEAQQFGEDPIQPVEAQIVEEAPKAIVANGDGDVATTGECRADVTNFCPTIKPGENRLAECLSNQLDMELKGNAEGKKLSAKCKEELAAFKIDEGTNINKNLPLAASCEADATKLCADSDPNDPGAVLACLREYKPDLSEACSDEIFKTEQEGAKDFRVDADLHAACQADAEQVCKDVEPGEGRVQDCLRAKHGEVSWECQEELFRQEVENADDIRLSIRLINACMADKKTFCSDVKPGNARVKDCLEEHREDPKFTQECRTKFEKMMGRRATDFRLDSSLREQCAEDIEVVCGYEKDSMDAIEGFDARVIQCLQDFKDELHDEQCKGQVHKLTERAAQDIRFDEPLAEACFDDRQKLCSGVQPGSSRVIACLQDKRDELSFECKATLFDQEVKMAEDIDFKYPMKKNCGAEIDKFCPTVQHGNGRIIRCLQDHLDDEDMSQECKAEVEQDQVRSNQDFRLNFRLSKACKKDIAALCIHECSTYLGQACGGKVLRCLTEKQEEIEDTDCKKEVFQFEKMEVSDMRNDAPMALACKADLETYCKGVKPGEGRLLKCLRDHKEDLSAECAAEDTKLAILQSQDIRLTPRLHQLCSGEVAAYCKDVKPGKARVFQCLQEHLGEPNFGKDCLEQVEARAQRMQEDYRLDYGVSTQCKEDVPQFCAAEQGKLHGHAEVQKCLISHASELDGGCQREMSRAVRMALWEYKPDMALTSVCDSDVEKICGLGGNGTSQRGLWNIGVVGRCLSRQLAEQKPIGEQCRSLVAVAAPQDAQELFNSSMNEAALTQRFLELQQAAGIKTKLVNPAASGAGAITLTGWVALVAVACIITTVMGGMYFVYKRILGPDPKSQYVVIKSGNV